MIIETESDLSVIGFSTNDEVNTYLSTKMHISESTQMWKNILSDNINGYIWNKMFIKEKIISSFDEKIFYSEDLVFCAEYLKNSKRMVYLDEKLYHYRINDSNVTSNTTYNYRIYTLLDAEKKLEELYKEYAPQYYYIIKLNTLKVALNLRARYKRDKVNEIEQYNNIKNVIHSYLLDQILDKKTKIPQKINLLFTYAFPVLLIKIKDKITRRIR